MKKKQKHLEPSTTNNLVRMVCVAFVIGYAVNLLFGFIFSLVVTLIRFNECAGSCGFHWLEWLEGWRLAFFFFCVFSAPVVGIVMTIVVGLKLKLKVHQFLLSLIPMLVGAPLMAGLFHLILVFLTTLIMAILFQIVPNAPYLPS